MDTVRLEREPVIKSPRVLEVPGLSKPERHFESVAVTGSKVSLWIAQRHPHDSVARTPASMTILLFHFEKESDPPASTDGIVGDPTSDDHRRGRTQSEELERLAQRRVEKSPMPQGRGTGAGAGPGQYQRCRHRQSLL
jgi:hypothetical protein